MTQAIGNLHEHSSRARQESSNFQTLWRLLLASSHETFEALLATSDSWTQQLSDFSYDLVLEATDNFADAQAVLCNEKLAQEELTPVDVVMRCSPKALVMTN